MSGSGIGYASFIIHKLNPFLYHTIPVSYGDLVDLTDDVSK